ncbi:hypothetical protein BI343_17885 [Chromobacterium amazonense]|uniref:hypothetical protein n=1 Tax=Chromobacterium amazonense TaxID=1382803 RepID=UPI0008DB2E3C|nr:hypothetical protein [Chromobacterium amazonense]OHX15829.1 hypothetical protein BI343_17885 [Chromobacterium amazonense]
MPYDYPARSLDIQAQLMMFGLRPNHLMLIGAFITAYGLFETTLERALWTLSEKSIEGVRPFTETMNTEAQFRMLGEGNSKLSGKCNAILKIAACAAEDLNEYRNSLVHGYILTLAPDSVPSFMKNPHWHGATGRKKPVGDAYIDEPIQDLVLIAVWNLFALVRQIELVFIEPDAQRTIEAMENDVNRAKSYASEARHLRSLMNHEKY